MHTYFISASRGGEDCRNATRKRIDAAKHQAWGMAYDALAANGLLDRQVAYDTRDKLDTWDGRGWVTLPCGPDRTVTIAAMGGRAAP